MRNIFRKTLRGKAPASNEVSEAEEARKKSLEEQRRRVLEAAMDLGCTIQSALEKGATAEDGSWSGIDELLRVIMGEVQGQPDHMQFLLDHRGSPAFVDSCLEAGLAPALIHCLRVMLMKEITTCKIWERNAQPGEAPPESTTMEPTARVCGLLAEVCSHGSIVEQLRPSLNKLLCIPVSCCPPSALHMQEQVLVVVQQLFRHALSSQLVWYLHDSKSIFHMVKSLRELIAIDDLPEMYGRTSTLRGPDAEAVGMWVKALTTIVDLLVRSIVHSEALIDDFVQADGPTTMTHMLVTSAPGRVAEMLQLCKMFVKGSSDPLAEESVHNVKGFAVFTEAALYLIDAEKLVPETMSLPDMCTVAFSSLEAYGHCHESQESLLTSVLLTCFNMYSEDPESYAALRELDLLPTILLHLPMFASEELKTLVLKMLQFVCTGIEDTAPLGAIRAMCAAYLATFKWLLGRVDAEDPVTKARTIDLQAESNTISKLLQFEHHFGQLFVDCGLLDSVFATLFNALLEYAKDTAAVVDGPLVALLTADLSAVLVTALREEPLLAGKVANTNLGDLICELLFVLPATSTACLALALRQVIMSTPAELCYNFQKLLQVLRRTSDVQKRGIMFDTASDLIATFPTGRLAWKDASGIAAVMQVLDDLLNTFRAAEASDEQHEQHEQQSLGDQGIAFRCLTSCVRNLRTFLSNATDSPASDMDVCRVYVRDEIGYETISYKVAATGVFESEYATDMIDQLFQCVEGTQPADFSEALSTLDNPEAFKLIITVLPNLVAEIAAYIFSKTRTMLRLSGPSSQRTHLFVETGLVRYILDWNRFYGILRVPHLKKPFQELLRDVCASYLPQGDFSALVEICLRPTVLPLTDSGALRPRAKLPPPTLTFQELTNQNGQSWELLELLHSVSDSLTSVPHVNMGPRSAFESFDAEQCTQLPTAVNYVEIRELGSLDPTYFPHHFTLSTWIQVSSYDQALDSLEESVQLLVPIVAFTDAETGAEFSVHIDCRQQAVVIKSTGLKSKRKQEATFMIPTLTDRWHHFALVVQHGKKLLNTKDFVSLYLDGLLIESGRFTMETFNLGQTRVSFGKPVTQMLKSTSERFALLPWKLGPCHLIDDALELAQLVSFIVLGPDYTGTFDGERPLDDSMTAKAVLLLSQFNQGAANLEHILQSLQLTGVETLIVPRIERSSLDAIPILGAIPPQSVLLTFNSTQTTVWNAATNSPGAAGAMTSPFDDQHFVAMMNLTSSNSITPVALVHDCQRVSMPVSLASGLDAMDGPALLFPLLQVADTPAKICTFLDLLLHATRGSPNAIFYMQNFGYRIAAGLLHAKPREMITCDVLDACFRCAIDVRPSSGEDDKLTGLLVDTAALYWLCMNHAVWRVERESHALHVVSRLVGLVQPDNSHAAINAQRLASLGCVAWCLHLMMRTATSRRKLRAQTHALKCSNCNRPRYEDSSDTEPDPLLTQYSTFLCQLMIARVRQQDVEYIAQLVLYTLHSVYVLRKPQRAEQDGAGEESPDGQDRDTAKKNRILHQAALTRVHLVGAMIQLLDANDTQVSMAESGSHRSRTLGGRSATVAEKPSLYRSRLLAHVFSPRWFIHVFNIVTDSATAIVLLRFLGVLLQDNEEFRDEFFTEDGFEVLAARVPEFAHEQAVFAVILALLFRASVAQVPVMSKYEPEMLWFFIDQPQGPSREEPMLTRFTLPLMHLLSESLARNASFRRLDEILTEHESCKPAIQQLAMDSNSVATSVLQLAYERCNDFRELLLDRRGLGHLLSAILGCANTLVTRLLDADNSHGPAADLTALIDEGYMELDRLDPQTQHRKISAADDIDTPALEIDVQNEHSQKLIKILRKVFHDSVFVYRKPALLSWAMIAFPSFTVGSFCRGFQSLVMTVFNDVIEEAYATMDAYPLRGVLESMVCLSGIITAALLDDGVVRVVLEHLIRSIDVIMSEHITASYGKDMREELLSIALPVTRYLSIMRYQLARAAADADASAAGQVNEAITWLRTKMRTLTTKVQNDELAPLTAQTLFSSSSQTIGPRNTPAAKLNSLNLDTRKSVFVGSVEVEAIGKLLLAAEEESTIPKDLLTTVIKAPTALNFRYLTQHLTPKQRLAQREGSVQNTGIRSQAHQARVTTSLHAFIAYLLCEMNRYYLCDDLVLRDEALRLTTALIIDARPAMSELFAVEDKAGNQKQIAPVWNDIVVPSYGKLCNIALLMPSYLGLLRNGGCDPSTESVVFTEFLNWAVDAGSELSWCLTSLEDVLNRRVPAVVPTGTALKKLQTYRICRSGYAQREMIDDRAFSEVPMRLHNELQARAHQWHTEIVSAAVAWRSLWLSLKGPSGFWEGTHRDNIDGADNDAQTTSNGPVQHWKLASIEGSERTRRRLIINYEFAQLYKKPVSTVLESVDELSGEGEDAPQTDGADSYMQALKNLARSVAQHHKPSQSNRPTSSHFDLSGDVEDDHGLFSTDNADPKPMFGGSNDNDDEDEGDYEGREDDRDAVGGLGASPGTTPSSPPTATPAGGGDTSHDSLSGAWHEYTSARATADGQNLATGTAGPSQREGRSSQTAAPLLERESSRISDDLFGRATEEGNSEHDINYNPGSNVSTEAALLARWALGVLDASERVRVRAYNVKHCCGLDARPALLLLSESAICLIDNMRKLSAGDNLQDGVELVNVNDAMEFKVRLQGALEAEQLQQQQQSAQSTVSPKGFSRKLSVGAMSVETWDEKLLASFLSGILQPNSTIQKIKTDRLFAIYPRRYQLRQTGLEVFDVFGKSFLFACDSNAEQLQVLELILNTPLPSSIYARAGARGVTNLSGYRKFLRQMKVHLQKAWLKGEISNFEYIMQLNCIAGRSFNDLTQYPVFPWVIADYESEELDLNNPSTFRDLSKPMGALSPARAAQFQERYQALVAFDPDGTPPFFYGTHYSCAGYVLYYLVRMEPYTRLALQLQGGRFDHPDRLFKDVAASWRSAAVDNLQDVRELVPEFYFLPTFLENHNKFELGTTQQGSLVDDVVLPPWAKGSAREFVRLNRKALESKYVSENLHHWIDLVFGFKRRGKAAVETMNLFVHLTYEEDVDIDSIDDPFLRDATISQVNNFGQTPSPLFDKPHPAKKVPTIVRRTDNGTSIDANAAAWHDALAPPFCVLAVPSMVNMSCASAQLVTTPSGLKGVPIGDVRLGKGRGGVDRIVAVPVDCVIHAGSSQKYIRYNIPSNGIEFRVATSTPRHIDPDRLLSVHELLHRSKVVSVATTNDGNLVATGAADGTIRLWQLSKRVHLRRLVHTCTYSRHMGKVTSVEISLEFGVLLSASDDGTAVVWDLWNANSFARLVHFSPVLRVGINRSCGTIFTLTARSLHVYDINGHPLASIELGSMQLAPATCLAVTAAPEWQEDAVVAAVGHTNGMVTLWRLVPSSTSASTPTSTANRKDEPSTPRSTFRYALQLAQSLVPVNVSHCAAITALRVSRQKPVQSQVAYLHQKGLAPIYDGGQVELLVGDAAGYVFRWSGDQLSRDEVDQLVQSRTYSMRSVSTDLTSGEPNVR